MTQKKLMYIVSDINKSLQFEWTASALSESYNLSFIIIGSSSSELYKFLLEKNIKAFLVDGSVTFWKAWFRVFGILYREKPDIVHAHLWRATIIGLTASLLAGVRQRIFTRHHAMTHYTEHVSGRKWDRLCNAVATKIVAISGNTRDILVNRDHANPAKVVVIPHGFQPSYFYNVTEARVANLIKKYGIPDKAVKVGVIARYIEWKGIQYVIEAFRQVLQTQTNAHLVIANAHGDYSGQIRKQIALLPRGSFTEITFEADLAALYKMLDVYVHVPVSREAEAFGQTYVEALMAGIPSVFTLSGIAPEFIVDRKNALVVNHRDARSIAACIVTILNDNQLRRTLVDEGRRSTVLFSFDHMVSKLKALYG